MRRNQFFVSVLTVFCLWVTAGAALAQQPPQAPDPEFTVKETAKEGANQGEWEVTTEIKNNRNTDSTIVFWSWPAAQGGAKIGDLKWHPAGTVPKNPNANHQDHKIPQDAQGTTNPGATIPANGTLTLKEIRKQKPHTTYVRVFKKQANNSYKQEQMIAHNVHMTAFHVSNTNPETEYLAIPVRIPYATDLANMLNGEPANFFVKSISVPSGWQTSYIAPALGERLRLLLTQREFTGFHVVRMLDHLSEGERAFVNVTWGVEDQDGKLVDYEMTIRNLVVRDNTPPAVALRTEARPGGTFVSIDVVDAGGIHNNAHLRVTRNGVNGRSQETLVVPFTRVLQEDPLQEIAATRAQFETLIPSCGAETLTLMASAKDQFGNSANSPEIQVHSAADDADAAHK